MSRIRILPEAVANRIAAGEAFERPASVAAQDLMAESRSTVDKDQLDQLGVSSK